MTDDTDEIIVFHNPGCSKSRQALALIEAAEAPHTVVEYLRTPPDRPTLESIVRCLGTSPAELVRTGDTGFAGLHIDDASLSSPARVVDLLAEHPELMQRPVVVRGQRAVIGRPPDRVVELLD